MDSTSQERLRNRATMFDLHAGRHPHETLRRQNFHWSHSHRLTMQTYSCCIGTAASTRTRTTLKLFHASQSCMYIRLVCEYCAGVFSNRSNVRKHIKTFHEKPENAREICDNCFTNRIMLAIDECRVGALQQLPQPGCNSNVQVLHGFTLLTHALLERS